MVDVLMQKAQKDLELIKRQVSFVHQIVTCSLITDATISLQFPTSKEIYIMLVSYSI